MASNRFRIEHDFLGDREVPADAYYGIQTLRGKENFHITGMPISREPDFVKAFGLCLQLGIMGILTPYTRGPSPVYYGSGYLPAADYGRLGAIFGVIFFAAFLVIGVPWMLFIR
jgi:hypothetical protein